MTIRRPEPALRSRSTPAPPKKPTRLSRIWSFAKREDNALRAIFAAALVLSIFVVLKDKSEASTIEHATSLCREVFYEPGLQVTAQLEGSTPVCRIASSYTRPVPFGGKYQDGESLEAALVAKWDAP